MIPACTIKENDTLEDSKSSKVVVFHAFAEMNNETKASVQENGTEAWWEPGDQIKVFRGGASGIFTAQIDSPSPTADFVGDFEGDYVQGEEIIAVYPAAAAVKFDGKSIHVDCPSSQIAVEGSFDRKAFISIAKTSNDTLLFKNICGGLKFTLSRDNIKSVVFSAKSDNAISGKISLQTDQLGEILINKSEEGSATVEIKSPQNSYFKANSPYYLCMLPSQLKEGFNITLYTDKRKATIEYSQDRTVKKSVFGRLQDIDKRAEYWESVISTEAVDLGLSIPWANMNLGAASQEEKGDYYAWGETETKDTFTFENYKWADLQKNDYYSKYNIDESCGSLDYKYALDPEDDAAHVMLGSKWRIPSSAEIDELVEKCTTVSETLEGITCIKFTGPNGNSIYIPTSSYIWGRELHESAPGQVSSLAFSASPLVLRTYEDRYKGLTIRPVFGDLVRVSVIKLNQSELALDVGGTSSLNANIYPKNASNKGVCWTSDNPEIVSVNQRGELIAHKDGTATIKVKSLDTEVQAECKVTVTKPIVPVTGISISKESLELFIDGTAQLTASVTPSNATNKEVIWSSDDYLLAYVSTTGLVRGCSTGTTTITVKSKDGGFKKTCVVTVKDMPVPTPVDLGLSVKWASFNVGASAPEDRGGLYAWGETSTKDKEDYTKSLYKWWEYRYLGRNTYTIIVKKYTDDNWEYSTLSKPDNTLEKDDDVAYANYGKKWHLPSCVQIKELIDKCEWTYTKIGNVSGYKVQSKKNSNYIFLPEGNYWSSSLASANWSITLQQKGFNGPRNNHWAYALLGNELGWQERYVGYMARAVWGESY